MATENLSWRQFEAGRDYNRRIGLYENAAENERFYRGDQWKNVNSGMLPTPVFNFVKRIIDFLVSQISIGNIDIVYRTKICRSSAATRRERASPKR